MRDPKRNAAPPPEEVGGRIGRHQVIGRLGAGGMAELFLARVTGIEGFEKLVALKRIRPELANDGELVRMFLDEARLAAKLQHPNIAQVFDIGVAGPHHFFTMEYVEGEDLRTIQRAAGLGGRRLPLEHALAVCKHVAAALHYAHTKYDSDGRPLTIVHRDVSPSNVLVSYDGCVKLVDFGIAKASKSSAVTRSGTLKGKMIYMSPEQCGGAALDARSDVFSLGLVLYELVAGMRPFELDSEVAVAHMLYAEDVPSPSARGVDVPADVEAVLMRALARDRTARYPTAQALELDLERLLVERRLVASSVALGRYMQTLFGARIEQRRSDLQATALRAAVSDEPSGEVTRDVVDVALEAPTSLRTRNEGAPAAKRGMPASMRLAVAAIALGIGGWIAATRIGDEAPAAPVQAPAALAEEPVTPPTETAATPSDGVQSEASAAPSVEPPPAAPRIGPKPSPPRKIAPSPKPRATSSPGDLDAPFPGGSWTPKGAAAGTGK